MSLAKHGLGLLAKITPMWAPMMAYQVVVTDPNVTHYVPVHSDGGEVWEVGVQVQPFILDERDAAPVIEKSPALVDGRDFIVPIHPTDSEGRQWFESMVVPSGRTLAAILAEAVSHGSSHPTHGTVCACMDQYAREVRAHVMSAIPGKGDPGEWEVGFDARSRISHILMMVVRNL
jgi:hypothetical protein